MVVYVHTGRCGKLLWFEPVLDLVHDHITTVEKLEKVDNEIVIVVSANKLIKRNRIG